MMDKLGIEPGEYVVTIYVNGENLASILEKIEYPLIFAESMKNNENNRKFSEQYAESVAGDYFGLPNGEVFFPSKRFLGEKAGKDGRTTLLICHCGNEGCADFKAKITVNKETVEWSNFLGGNPDWKYDKLGSNGKFVFDRKRYESELAKKTSNL
ncbi:MAG: hypothetical protein ABII22_06990 [Candidatus Micrarchaeota archaeon]